MLTAYRSILIENLLGEFQDGKILIQSISTTHEVPQNPNEVNPREYFAASLSRWLAFNLARQS